MNPNLNLVCLAFFGLLLGHVTLAADPTAASNREVLIFLKEPTDTPDPFSPGSGGTNKLSLELGLALTGELLVLHKSPEKPSKSRHFLRVTEKISQGNIVFTTLIRDIEVLPPFTTSNYPPGAGAGNREYAVLPVYLDWSGSTETGAIAQDGVYETRIEATYYRLRHVNGTQLKEIDEVKLASGSVTLDRAAPQLTVSPPSGTISITGLFNLSAQFLDSGSGVDPQTFQVNLDGNDVTSNFTVTDGAANWQLTTPLIDGSHLLRVELRDRAGNSSVAETSFVVDSIAPSITISPHTGELVSTARPTIDVTLEDSAPSSGLDEQSFHAALDGEDVTIQFQLIAGRASWTPTHSLSQGLHSLSITIKDLAGNQSTNLATFTIDSVAPLLSVSPTHGSHLTESTPAIIATYADPDPGVGLDLASLQVLLDGQDISGLFTTDPVQARYAITQENSLADGTHVLIVRLQDQAGNQAEGTSQFTVETAKPPTVTLVIEPQSILEGQSATLTWHSTDATSATISPDVGEVQTNGLLAVSPRQTTSYQITVTGPKGTQSASADLTVIPLGPTVEIAANPPEIQPGTNTTLTWSSTGADRAFIDHGVGEVPASGSILVSPSSSTRYTITVIGASGLRSDDVLVKSLGDPILPPSGTFGHKYADLVPDDATVQFYDKSRFSLVTGTVQDLAGEPVAGTQVHVLAHPEYGTTTSGADGRYSLPVDGGKTLTIVHQKTNYIPVQRAVEVPWNDIAIVDSVRLMQEETKATLVAFDGNPNSTFTHKTQGVTDSHGARSCTVVFAGDTVASLTNEAGVAMAPLSTITVRGTEYPTPDSMPADLPPNSAFTYCVELKVDGADRVKFSKPVVTWVDNFLEFNVGLAIPIGSYDRDCGCWIPSKNGIVVRLLDTNADGIVDSLDSDGNDLPNDLDSNGSFINEVAGLSDSQSYQPNSTYWRVEIDHFSPHDLNLPVGKPADATPPNEETPPVAQEQKEEPKTCKKKSPKPSSLVEERSQILHEDIPIAGTLFSLHYSSGRTPGYKTKISVPASGPSVPASLTRISVTCKLAGREFQQLLPPQPNQRAEFIWDGLDHLGRPAGHSIAHTTVTFEYPLIYLVPALELESFGLAGVAATDVLGRQQALLQESFDTPLYPFDYSSPALIAPGWTISASHHFDAKAARLYLGDGYFTDDSVSTINTIAGNGLRGTTGDDGPALGARMDFIEGVSVDGAGNVYVCDPNTHRVRKVDAQGIITRFAGNGLADSTNTPAGRGDGGPAVLARLNRPTDIDFDPLGNAYITTTGTSGQLIRKVDKNGIITTFAGNGLNGAPSDDGELATNSRFRIPIDVAVDVHCNVYVADQFNRIVRKISPAGLIYTVAGNGDNDSYGDGGLAVEAGFESPTSIAVDALGNLYIANGLGRLVRKVDPSGIVSTVAGFNFSNHSLNVDGFPATAVGLRPNAIALDRQSRLLILDNNSRLLRMDSKGVLTTLSGHPTISAFSGDGGPAQSARLSRATDLAIDSSGAIYLADSNALRVRKISPPSAIVAGVAADETVFPDASGAGFVIDADGRHARTIDLLSGRSLLQIGHDEQGRPTQILDLLNNTTLIHRDLSGRVDRIISPDGVPTLLEYAPNGDLARVGLPGGSSYLFEYSGNGLMIVEVKPAGNRYERTYDQNGRLVEVEDEEGGRWTFDTGFEADGSVVSTTGTAEGTVTQYDDRTDSSGNFTSAITSPDGSEAAYSEPTGRLSSSRSAPCGSTINTSSSLDPQYKFRFVSSVTEKLASPLQRTSTISRSYSDVNADGLPDVLVASATTNSKTGTLTFDKTTGTVTSRSHLGRISTTHFDTNTLLLVRRSDPGQASTDYSYGAGGKIESVARGERRIQFNHNASGYLATVTDPLERITAFDYDAALQLREVTQPDLSTIGFDRDGDGRITRVSPSSLVGHEYTYTDVGLPETYRTPSGKIYAYEYDRDRRLRSVKFPSSRALDISYSGASIDSIVTPHGTIQVDYLCSSKIGAMTFGSESLALTYDGPLVTSIVQTGTLNRATSVAYDSDFRVSSMTYAGGTTTLGYDNDGLLTQAGSFAVTRHPQTGFPTSISDGVVTRTPSFSEYGELATLSTALGGNTIAEISFTRARTPRIETRRITIGALTTEYSYTYDLFDRLLSVVQNGSVVESYDYDGLGRRTTEVNHLRGIPGRSFSYNAEDQVLTAGSESFTYDDDGFMSTRSTPSQSYGYTYSLRGELLAVTRTDGTLIQYVTDPMGRRIAKKVNGTVVEKYLWSGNTSLLAVLDGSDNLVARFEPGAVRIGGVRYYLINDQVGSTRALVDQSGTIAKEVIRDSFGNIVFDSNPALNAYLGFAGGLEDRDTGLVLFGYRNYLPAIGRWTAKDPLFLGGGDLDVYVYCGQDPVNRVDPDGTFWLVAGLLAAEALAEVVLTVADIKSTIETFNDPCATASEKVASAGLTAAGIILPLGGFSKGSKSKRLEGGLQVEETDLHHIFPQADEFAERFRDARINVDDFLIEIPRSLHIGQHDGRFMGSGGFWNNQWRNFFGSPTAVRSREEIVGFAQQLLRDMGLEGMPLRRK